MNLVSRLAASACIGLLLGARVPAAPAWTAAALALAALALAAAWAGGAWASRLGWTRVPSAVGLALLPSSGGAPWGGLPMAFAAAATVLLVLLSLRPEARAPPLPGAARVGMPWLRSALVALALAAALLLPAAWLRWGSGDLATLDEAAQGGAWLLAAAATVLALAALRLLRRAARRVPAEAS